MFDKLFEPLQVGSITLRNRMVMTAMSSKLVDDEHRATERTAAYYAARAAGGFGLITTGYLSVMHNSLADPEQGALYDDSFTPGLARVAEAVHAAAPDAKLFAQIVHTGNLADVAETGEEAVGASSVPVTYLDYPIHELSTAEAWEIIAAFADAAERAQKAGCDGVEVHGAHGYLIGQFLSPRSNKRVDEFGGTVANRARFACEVIKAVKARCGADFPVSFRFSASEDMEGGSVPEELAAMAPLFEEAGADMLNVSVGTCESGTIIQSHYSRPGFNVPAAQLIKEAVDVPVCVVGRINDPAVAERIVASGAADLAGFGRQTLADPEFANKAREGRLSEIVACTGCMQRCIGMPTCGPEDTGVSCMLNPFSGKESLKEWQLNAADEAKRVVVVGAGPAGLMAARVAALRGHDVTVLEQEECAGGQYRLAAMPPEKTELAKTIQSFEALAKKAGAKICYGVEVIPEVLAEQAPEAVLLATGAVSIWPRIPGIDSAHVLRAFDVLAGRVVTGRNKKVLVVGAGLVGCETAEFLAGYGHSITVVDMVSEMAGLLNATPRAKMLERFAEHGVEFIPSTGVVSFTEDGAEVKPVKRGEDGRFADAGDPYVLSGYDYVVVAMGARAYNPLEEAAHASCENVHVIGDAERAGDAKKGIYQAARVALEL